MPVESHIIELLHQQGFRATGPRRAIVEAALSRQGRFTAAEMVDELHPQGVGRATVFRTLDLLTNLGMLERIHADDRCHTYTLCDGGHHHHHLICTGCSRVTEVSSGAIEQAIQLIAHQTQFRVEHHLVEIQGLCQACQASVPSENAATRPGRAVTPSHPGAAR